MSMSTTMIITIVPPIGPPIPILVGRAIRSLPNSTLDVFLKPEFEKAKKLSWKQNLTRVSKHFGVGYYTTSQILTVHLFTNFILWQLSIGSSFNLGHRQTHRLWARATELLYNCFTLFIRTVTSTLSLWGKKIGIKVFQKTRIIRPLNCLNPSLWFGKRKQKSIFSPLRLFYNSIFAQAFIKTSWNIFWIAIFHFYYY